MGQLSPSAVLDDALARIASIDGELSSFVAIDADRARRAAEAAEEELKNGRWRGQLHGVPIAGKELFDVENLTATYGSQARARVVAAADSEVVRRLRRAGAVIVGLTRSHEFGWGITTQHPSRTGTRNPWNLGLYRFKTHRKVSGLGIYGVISCCPVVLVDHSAAPSSPRGAVARSRSVVRASRLLVVGGELVRRVSGCPFDAG